MQTVNGKNGMFVVFLSLCSLSYSMENPHEPSGDYVDIHDEMFAMNAYEILAMNGGNTSRVPIANATEVVNVPAATERYDELSNERQIEAAINFETNLANQDQEFWAFASSIMRHTRLPWRNAIPFMPFNPRKRFISLDGYVLPLYIRMSDFVQANSPYFYSYDEAGRPFIAFIFREKNDLGYGEPRIQVYYYNSAYSV